MQKELSPYISPLIGDFNALGIEELKRLLDDKKVSREELETVLTDDLLESLEQYRNSDLRQYEILPGSDKLRGDEGRTEVFFWGMKGSGKTSVIGSLIAAQPQLSAQLNNEEALERSKSMCEVFAETGYNTLVPIELVPQTNQYCSVINADIKDKKGNVHPLAFIEMNEMSASKSILKATKNDKIHFLCYDSTHANSKQDDAFITLLKQLKSTQVLDKSVGVYLLVTKCDTFSHHQPSFRDEIAQSLIVQDHLGLWTTVKNLCAEMQISDTTPIPFSIGDVSLKRLIKIDLTCARNLIERPLSLKSYAYRSALGKLVMSGSLPVTATLLSIVCAAMMYFIYSVVPGISNIPTDKFKAYDFKEYFLKEESDKITNRYYYSCRKDFRRLENELSVERNLKLADGKKPISSRDCRECESKLYNDIAQVVHGGMSHEIKGGWSESTLKMLGEVLTELADNYRLSENNRELVQEDLNIVNDYFSAITLASNVPNCTSEEDVEDYKAETDKYRYAPLSNCASLMKKLDDAVERAEEDYADYIRPNGLESILRNNNFFGF